MILEVSNIILNEELGVRNESRCKDTTLGKCAGGFWRFKLEM